MIFYHLTPRRNVGSILRKGLLPSPSTSMGSWEEGPAEEDTRGKIFLGTSGEECIYNLWNTRVNNPDDVKGIKGWALLEVSLPSNWPLTKDGYGFIYTEEPVPPRYTRFFRNITMRDMWNMEEEGRFQKWREEVF